MIKTIKLFSLFLMFAVLCACGHSFLSKKDSPANTSFNAQMVFPEAQNIVRTSKGASELDIETPLRCFVNNDTQQLITTIPYNLTAFNLVKNGNNDVMPKFEVNGFSFKTMPAEKALQKLAKEAGIKIIAKDAPYPSISAENLRGSLSDIIQMISEAAEFYYSYDAHNKTLKMSRTANFSLFVPKSKPIMLALLDVLRGAGITNITTDWDDFSITFDADFELKNKIMQVIGYFEENPTLIAYDVSVLKIYPYTLSQTQNQTTGIKWQNLLSDFDINAVKTTKTGVIGKVITTSNAINFETLQAFLQKQAMVSVVAQGKFIVPNLWLSRFDVGKCSKQDTINRDLSIMARASLEQNHRLFSDITLDTTEGEASRFSIRSKLGENILIIGIPNKLFAQNNDNSEIIVMMVPRIIRTTKTSKHLENNL